MQATQTLACICMALSAATALVFIYFSAVLRCSREAHSGRYCFQLNFTYAPQVFLQLLRLVIE